MKKAKRKNPQDATLRNIRALKRRVADLERQVNWMWKRFPPSLK